MDRTVRRRPTAPIARHISGFETLGLAAASGVRPSSTSSTWLLSFGRGLTASGGHSVAELLDALESEGFNTVRLPLTLLSVLANPKLSDESLQNSPAIYNQHYVDAVDAIATLAARRGLMVVLAASRLAPEDVPHNPLQRMPHGLWWSEQVAGAFNGYEFPKSRVIEAWRKLAWELTARGASMCLVRPKGQTSVSQRTLVQDYAEPKLPWSSIRIIRRGSIRVEYT